ncbi:MAG: hypothetical protein ACI4K5_05860 [Ruminococcus sp.]
MKNYRLLSAVVLSGMILASFGGCGNKDNSSSEVPSAESSLDESQIAAVQKPGLKFTYGEPSTSGNTLDNPDPTAPATTSSSNSGNAVTSVATVTDAQGSAVTQIADVTDSAGAVVTTQAVVTDSAGTPVTEAGGAVVTTVVNVTEVVNKTEIVTDSDKPDDTETTTSGGSSYQADMKTFNAMWLDVSESKNYTFNDTFIEVKVKINEDIPDGKYPINITWPDFAAYDPEVIGKSIDPDHTVNGYIYVNVPAEEQTIPSDGFTVIAENVEAKQGGEAVIKFDIKNNPGICAVNFNFEYDENAITIDSAYAVGEFEKISDGNLS